MPPRRTGRARGAAAATAAMAAAALGSACAAPAKESWREAAPPEAYVEVLPRDAQLWVDGVEAGRGARAVPVPDAQHVYVFRAAAPGFAPAERAGEGARLAGARVGIVLRPDDLGTARRLELDEPAGLVTAGAALLRARRPAQAAEYAERAAELAPDEPGPHRLLAEADRALGDGARAAREYDAYLRLAPDAADREEVEREIEALRKDVTVPGR
jgi:hypothetical protein